MNNKLIDLLFEKLKEIKLYYKATSYPNTSKDKFEIIDLEGYKYSNSYSGLLKNYKRKSKMDRVSCYNPYSIENIKKYLEINIPKLYILENEFKNAKHKMKFKCDICGEIYDNWDNISHGVGCPSCNLKIKHTDEDIINKVKEFSIASNINYKWIGGKYKSSGCKNLILKNDEGYRYVTSYNSMDSNIGSKIWTFDYRSKFIIYNIKLFLKKNKSHIKLISKKTSKQDEKLLFYCKKHDEYFYRSISSMIHNLGGCDKCRITSKGEARIIDFLKMNNIKYTYEKEYDGLIGLGGGNLSYDFYLPKYNLLIEYQGEQHEHYVKGFHKSKKDFEKQQEHDRRKKQYAKDNNIKLLEIWYWDFDNIENILNQTILNNTK